MADFATTYLRSFINYEHGSIPSDLGAFQLDRIQKLLGRLRDPHKAYPVIHIVGTKGKGSTAIFLASALREAGLKVGLYTSPHLYDVKERIRVLAPQAARRRKETAFEGKISRSAFERILKILKPQIDHVLQREALGKITFFEVMTAAAFYFFEKQKVDVAVLEAGLGGRLDATNVSASDLCVITSISLDHTAQLGKTLQSIAREKSAIIKKSTQAIFLSQQTPQVNKVIYQVAKKYQVPLFQVGRQIRCRVSRQGLDRTCFSLRMQDRERLKLQVPLLGSHQAQNASLAASAAWHFLKQKGIQDRKAIEKGLANAVWPGRCEIVKRHPDIIVDSAHNGDSMRKFLLSIKSLFPGRKAWIIFGASCDKNISNMLSMLVPHAKAICLTRSRHPRSFDFNGQIRMFRSWQKNPRIFSTAANCSVALHCFLKKARKQDIILATGSVFIASEIRKYAYTTHK